MNVYNAFLNFFFSIKVVQWSEDLYETQLIERTKDACDGEVDIVIDFGSTSRSLNRSLQCLQEVCVIVTKLYENSVGN